MAVTHKSIWLAARSGRRIVTFACALALMFGASQPVSAASFNYQVAARCKGEASFALSACACTVRNRLQAGWSQNKVLHAYHAPDARPTAVEVELVGNVLDGAATCDARLYYMYGLGDVFRLGLQHTPPLLKIVHGQKQVWFYGR